MVSCHGPQDASAPLQSKTGGADPGGWGTLSARGGCHHCGGLPVPRAALVPQSHGGGTEGHPSLSPWQRWQAVLGMNTTDHYLSACSFCQGFF